MEKILKEIDLKPVFNFNNTVGTVGTVGTKDNEEEKETKISPYITKIDNLLHLMNNNLYQHIMEINGGEDSVMDEYKNNIKQSIDNYLTEFLKKYNKSF